MSPDDPRHGTDAGYQRHYRDGEPACEPCRDARRIYVRDVRQRNGGISTSSRVLGAARGRALTRLARLYPKAYEGLLREEMAVRSVVIRKAGDRS